jgi:hypothetical protein
VSAGIAFTLSLADSSVLPGAFLPASPGQDALLPALVLFRQTVERKCQDLFPVFVGH